MPIEIKGNWKTGFALELHTIDSKYLGCFCYNAYKNQEKKMTKVFIAGSRHLWQLNEMVRNRILNVINKKYQVFVGDANGIDKAVQKFLKNIHYENVRVFCSGNRCRNNVGNWETVNINVPDNIKGLKFYMAKDIEMAKEANFGFMIWDGKSAGTLNNIIQLLKQNKKTLIYFSPEKTFINIVKFEDVKNLINKCEKEDFLKIDKKIKVSETLNDFNQLNL